MGHTLPAAGGSSCTTGMCEKERTLWIARSVATPHRCLAITTTGCFGAKTFDFSEAAGASRGFTPGRLGSRQCRMSMRALMMAPATALSAAATLVSATSVVVGAASAENWLRSRAKSSFSALSTFLRLPVWDN